MTFELLDLKSKREESHCVTTYTFLFYLSKSNYRLLQRTCYFCTCRNTFLFYSKHLAMISKCINLCYSWFISYFSYTFNYLHLNYYIYHNSSSRFIACFQYCQILPELFHVCCLSWNITSNTTYIIIYSIILIIRMDVYL